MDVFAHGLWAGAAAKIANKNSAIAGKIKRPLKVWQAIFWGIFPDRKLWSRRARHFAGFSADFTALQYQPQFDCFYRYFRVSLGYLSEGTVGNVWLALTYPG